MHTPLKHSPDISSGMVRLLAVAAALMWSGETFRAKSPKTS